MEKHREPLDVIRVSGSSEREYVVHFFFINILFLLRCYFTFKNIIKNSLNISLVTISFIMFDIDKIVIFIGVML